jgi:quercetin dioxygenase-like cupin family protein
VNTHLWGAIAALVLFVPAAQSQQEVDPTWYDPVPNRVVAQPSQPKPLHRNVKRTMSNPDTAHVLLTPDKIKWQPLPREWADGPPPAAQADAVSHATEVAIMQGDPTKVGAPFVLRLRSAPGARIPPHWYPADENLTVLSGVFCVGTGDNVDENTCRDMPAGSYMVLPKGMHHFAIAKGDVIQIHGVGPFKIYWVR